jgi:outer membrane protein
MKPIFLTALTLAATVLTATAAPRIALIRVKDIYTDLPSTAALQQQIKAERDEIMKDQRATDLRRIISELQDLHARLSDKNNPLSEEISRKFARSYEIKRQEAQTLQKEFEQFRNEREKEINRRMVAGMRASLDEIMETSRKVGRERGYDLVFDGSGNTNTGLAFVLYSKESPDLTDDVKAALEDAAKQKTATAKP